MAGRTKRMQARTEQVARTNPQEARRVRVAQAKAKAELAKRRKEGKTR